MIPKIVNQIWMQGEVPQKYSLNVQSIKDKNPSWTYRLWNEKSIREVVSKLGQKYLDKYDGFKLLHQRVDMGRIALLYESGGVSVDTDVEAIKGFDSLPDLQTSDFIVSRKSHTNDINNATILVSKNNPILKGLLDYMLNLPDCKSYQSNFSCVTNTTGPKVFNEYLKQYKDQITVLDNSYLEPCNFEEGCSLPQNAILNHKHELSWINPMHKKLLQIGNKYKWRIACGIILIVILIIIFRKQ